MFTYLKLTNYKSFDNVKFDFKKTAKDVKKFIALYGENGSGKTNFVDAFNFIDESCSSLFFTSFLKNQKTEFYENYKNNKQFDPTLIEWIDSVILNNIMKNVQMIGSKDDTEIEYGFKIGNIEGYYLMKFKDILKAEKLYYSIGKKRGILFDINYESDIIQKDLNDSIFHDKKYKKELCNEIDKYWGKYTFLSIFYNELNRKNKEYIHKNISKNLFDVIDEFKKIKITYNSFSDIIKQNANKEPVNLDFIDGKIGLIEEEELDKYEKILKIFFTQAYSDIKDVYYKKEYLSDNKIEFKLYFKKIVANRLIDIAYDKESTGTQKILYLFDSLIAAINGKTVIIDEIDNGIHDILMKTIIESLKDEITGQMIITTHNTLLLETLENDDVYVIKTDYEGHKEINCVNDYDFKIQKNHNLKELYLKGLFDGVPLIDCIDFNEIKQYLKDK